ncbi:uncharacterized protein AMSG_10465 [Thecamonas trahens ATCC 50062]|uniref:DUF4476 domain-containing protein n=1 Tax=Thecamonas trahens ATCC 50062 TaxID=461836 RepID=A0A0L0DSN7_THETB|nr:hypothetical protein AMSG_10465 [Thecamonas trahens ATCC 50062]KNC54468.1 hypothetical protein AMSG_10465 [Thecamonas trahens ATCC 50062]|eukprot:XP_013753623.1 hypothetical protein AMSG_10465 [Thecamonas trahens ATCC 50062]
MSRGEQVTESQLSELCEQVENHREDKDRLRILKNVLRTEEFFFTVAQIATIVPLLKFGDPKVEAAIALHSRLLDPSEDYGPVLDLFKFKEDKDTINAAISS